MPTQYAALLRGINVGGNNIIKMADLRQTFEEMKYSGVKTFIQSGNVIFSADEKDKVKLAETIEEQLSRQYQYEARIVLLTLAELTKIIAGIPAGFGEEPEAYRYDLWFLREPATPAEVMKSVQIREGVDQVYPGKKVVYVSRLVSQAGKSRLTRIIGEPVYQSITIRNWNTSQKLLELMKG